MIEEELTELLVAEANDLLKWKVRAYMAEKRVKELVTELEHEREQNE